MYAWLHVVANALEHSGADMDKFGYSNDGDYVPARVAKSWADSLEKGICDLKVAVIYHSGNPPFVPGHAVFVVHRSYTEEQTMKDFNRGSACSRARSSPSRDSGTWTGRRRGS